MSNIATSINVNNVSLRNHVRIKYQDAIKDDKGKATGRWKDVPTVAMLAPHETLDVCLGEGRRAVVEWVPT